MKFHLSTLLLAILVAALGLGWYLNSTKLERDKIVGRWQNAKSGKGFWTSLEIHENGTFTKSESGRTETSFFRGTYALQRFGMITFAVTSMEHRNDDLQQMYEHFLKVDPSYSARQTPPNFTKPIDASITCHSSFDAEEILKLEQRSVQNPRKHPDKELPGWGSFKRSEKSVAQ